MTGLIGPIGYTVERVDGDVLTVALPSWRTDSHVEIDVVEEVARHHGYDTIGTAVPNSTMHGRLSPEQLRRRQLREVLLGCGLSEAITDSFLHRGDLGRAHLPDGAIHVTNPLQADEDVLRPSMRVGMLKAIAFNESHRRRGVQLFEIGHVYPPGDRSTELPPEYDGLSVAIAGGDARGAMALWREIAKAMGFGARVDQGTVPAGLHPTRSATLSLGKDVVGAVGEVHPDVCDAFGVDERVAWLELDLSRLLAVAPKIAQWKPTSRFPSTDLDLAFVVPDQVAAEKVDKAIRQAAVGLLVDLTLFDVYRGRGVDEGARSLAYRLRLQAPDRTLTDAEVTQVKDKVVAGLAKLRAVLRS
ncbi:MAG: hypothetical protein R2713_04680 [Ilumatobacteraceae bacterium]